MGKGRSESERLSMEWRQMRQKENKGDTVTRILRERQEQDQDKTKTSTVYETGR
jgi:hypothetical protein